MITIMLSCFMCVLFSVARRLQKNSIFIVIIMIIMIPIVVVKLVFECLKPSGHPFPISSPVQCDEVSGAAVFFST